jgi:hypothetical protein
MSVIVFPSSLKVESSTWSQTRLDLAFDSVFGSQGVEVSPPLWDVVISSPEMFEQESGEWQALLMKLRGQTNQLELWNHGRSTPRGTMRGTMTLNIAASQGDVVLSIIAATEATKTLKAGDLLGIGSASTKQVVMVMADATADGTGVISVTIEPPLRNSHLIAASVTWNKPTILFRRKQSQATWDYKNIMASGFSLDLIEDFRT